MGRAELEDLVQIGKLAKERPDASEVDGRVESGRARLVDARNEQLIP